MDGGWMVDEVWVVGCVYMMFHINIHPPTVLDILSNTIIIMLVTFNVK